MNRITRLEIKGLHGHKSFDIRIDDNTLILVGENGAGKTTALHILYYLLSTQWASLAKYKFASVAITIDGTKHTVLRGDVDMAFDTIDRAALRRFPSDVRSRILLLLERTEGRLVMPELERICAEYGIPISFLLDQIDLGRRTSKGNAERIRASLAAIQSAISAQLLYLPTYRRIEQELSLIFHGIDERELSHRRELLSARRSGETYVELVEFGMKDVDAAINQTRAALDKFARESLTNLTFTYLGDIVEEQYQSVNVDEIRRAEQRTIDDILDRIPESILSAQNKQHLRQIIGRVKIKGAEDVHAQVICHYFTKLMAFHRDLAGRESRIVNFCRACNDYMVDKEFDYDRSNFTISIRSREAFDTASTISLQDLSSGEKQIVSLFSHLYLAGDRRYFVLIDEPELSLSVVWQKKFLADIRKGDFCVGLVAVTHSPFIYDNSLLKYAHGLDEFRVAN